MPNRGVTLNPRGPSSRPSAIAPSWQARARAERTAIVSMISVSLVERSSTAPLSKATTPPPSAPSINPTSGSPDRIAPSSRRRKLPRRRARLAPTSRFPPDRVRDSAKARRWTSLPCWSTVPGPAGKTTNASRPTSRISSSSPLSRIQRGRPRSARYGRGSAHCTHTFLPKSPCGRISSTMIIVRKNAADASCGTMYFIAVSTIPSNSAAKNDPNRLPFPPTAITASRTTRYLTRR